MVYGLHHPLVMAPEPASWTGLGRGTDGGCFQGSALHRFRVGVRREGGGLCHVGLFPAGARHPSSIARARATPSWGLRLKFFPADIHRGLSGPLGFRVRYPSRLRVAECQSAGFMSRL